MTEVVPLDPTNAGAATQTFSQAFCDDPMFVYIQPDEGKRMRVVESQRGLLVNMALRSGVTDVNPDAKGIVSWMPPGQKFTPIDMLRTGALSVPFQSGFSPFAHFMGAMDQADKGRAKAIEEPHWYLAGAAVDPEVHGQRDRHRDRRTRPGQSRCRRFARTPGDKSGIERALLGAVRV